MTYHRRLFELPGGYLNTEPGTAALASVFLRTPISGTPAAAAIARGASLEVIVGTQSTFMAVGGAEAPQQWLGGLDCDQRLVPALITLHRKAAQAILVDPVERILHGVESAGWGTSGWEQRWGEPMADTDHATHLSALLRRWSQGYAAVTAVPADVFAQDAGGALGTWRGRVVCERSGGSRILIGAGVPLDGSATAAIAAQYLGTPLHGRLFTSLRGRTTVAYGLMAAPVARDGRTMLVVGVSTRPEHAVECVRRLTVELAALRSDPPDPASWRRRLRLDQVMARNRVHRGLPVTPLARCVLELGEVAGYVDARFTPLGPTAWFATGPLPLGLDRTMEEAEW